MLFYNNVVLEFRNDELKIISARRSEHHIKTVVFAKGRSGGGQVVQQSNAPWAGQAGHLQELFREAQSQYHGGGPLYSPISSQREAALQGIEQRALSGSPVTRAMQSQIGRTLGGDYLYGGEGFNAALEAAKNKIIPDIQSRYAKAGRFGSGLARQAEAQALSDAFAKQYGQERQNQIRAALFAPQAAAADYEDLARLGSVGAEREALQQRELDTPQERLRRYHEMISGSFGSSGYGRTSNVGGSGFSGSGAIGTALGGAGLAALAGGGWVPMGIGAGIGGLLGGIL